MKLLIVTCLVLLLALLVPDRQVEGGVKIYLKPLSAKETYEMLRSAGQEDAVPEGRIITRGLAALTGFTIGLAKGIGGAALVSALAGAGGLSMASLIAQNANISSNSGGGGTVTMSTQEICFNTRSLNEVEDEENGSGRQAETTTGTAATTAPTLPTTTASISPTSPTTPDTGTDSVTPSATTMTTETDSGSTINCIVLQKPMTS